MEKIGHNRIIRELGKGAFGTTYLARDELTERKVVLKFANADPRAAAALMREMSVASRLASPHIVQIYHAEEHATGQVYLVREWVDGESLEESLKHGLSLEQALDVIDAIGSALETLHQSGIIHRDIKPSNVLIPYSQGRLDYRGAMLADFGLAGFLEQRRGEQLTQAGQVFGTLALMSPEQMSGERQSVQTDVYGLAALLYFVLYGRGPRGGNIREIFANVQGRREIEFPDRDIRVPGAIRDVLRRALAVDPIARYGSAAEFRVELREARRGGFESTPVASVRCVREDLEDDRPTSPGIPIPARLAPPPAPSAPRASSLPFTLIAPALLLISLGVATFTTRGAIRSIILGAFVIVAALAVALAVRAFVAHRRRQADEVTRVILGAESHEILTTSLAVEVDELLRRCREVDERMLGKSVAIFIREYESAKDFDDRQQALMNAMELLDKLMARLSPWYVRYEKPLAIGISLLGVVPGVIEIVRGANQLAK